MAEGNFVVEIERENGDGKRDIAGHGPLAANGVGGISRSDSCSSVSGSSDRNLPVKEFKSLELSAQDNSGNGTVEFEIPVDIRHHNVDFGTKTDYEREIFVEGAEVEDAPQLPPIHIVMLIVGYVDITSIDSIVGLVRFAVEQLMLEFFGRQMVIGPTSEFPHPLSRVRQQVAYKLSYQIVDSLIWLGIRDMINEFRRKKLKLRRVTYLSGSYGSHTDTPCAYIWSPHLVPKPKDWGPNIDVVGFYFMDLASNYEPPDSLMEFLRDGKEPIYIVFGSLPAEEPGKMTQIIVEALEITGQRGIINKGWGGLGNLAEPKDFIYSLDNCPHDWLFTRCAAVVHHGGAGTTAAGLKAAIISLLFITI
ncbi:Sterol 3-beta-glucosyltransferase UGT80A2 [Striga hermonthica]|uniref:Sterol 3-beta-glucosyltransferase UGT80A2 n=1 Tax=Striga hermonthica TaxID=68872 RepID=A0A9N7N0Q8_STRHE|nr:Sterol 3-beta-glucosyltransferase UGT80A2 [Striga hermonthica]